MYRVNPRKLYVMDWATRIPGCMQRVQRMVRGMGRDPAEVAVLRREDLPEVIARNGWVGDVRQGAYHQVGDPDIVFSASHWVDADQREEIASSDFLKACVAAYSSYGDCREGYSIVRTLAMLGAAPFYHSEPRAQWQTHQVCWSLHDLHSAWGCFHRCAYCQRGSVYVINVDLEAFVEHVDQLLADNPWQKTIRYDVEQDVLAIEPEYGACELLVNDFARRPDRYLILFSKSANVDHLLSLDHRGHTIMLWTLSTHTVSRQHEPKTGTMEERIEAARRCQAAGYPVRFKCKPIVPIRNWREEITDMLEKLYAAVQPENLSMEMVFFTSVSEMDRTLGLANLDPAFVAAAEKAEVEAGDKWPRDRHGERPFPFEVKEPVYRHFLAESKRLSPSTPVTLCAETHRMWTALADLLDHKPWDYVCNCGPHCIPGLGRIAHVEGPDVDRIAQARSLGRIPAS